MTTQRLRRLLQRYLAENGFRVSTAETAADARDRLRFLQPDLLVLDVMMPGESGLDLTQALRRERAAEGRAELPVLLLTARGAPEDRIAGFEAGADDYLGKPFDPRELVLRIRAMLRRAAPAAAAPAPPPVAGLPVALGRLAFDTVRLELTRPAWRGPPDRRRGGAARTAGRSVRARCCRARRSRRRSAWTTPASAPIDVQVTRLRRKVEADPREPRFLHTVRGRGYVLKPGA